MPRILRFSSAAMLMCALALPAAAGDCESRSAGGSPELAALRRLAAQVDMPYTRFVLPNGLVTIVHTDRKAPVVGVTLYYRAGSRDEPRGHAGFAHLYEHLFFGGSQHAPSFEAPLKAAGSTQPNGSTYYDRTNYVETVPTGALDLALFLESDRMGWLLPAVTQDKLDRQRGVVENEKRQGDNDAYGLVNYAVQAGLFPPGHPYHHAPVGSNADLDAATLSGVRRWFADHYGPNNAVLVLTGDIDARTARAKVEKWFGAIPRGAAIAPVAAGPVTLPARVHEEMTDAVPATRLTRNWSGPGLNDADAPALQAGMEILGGMPGSRLERALVRAHPVASGVSARDIQLEGASMLQVSLDVAAGQARTAAGAALDAAIQRFLDEGPSADELERAVMGLVSRRIGELEAVGGFTGQGAVLAEGEVYSHDPAHYRRELAELTALTPEKVREAMRKWLLRPVYALDVVPGERKRNGADMGGDGGPLPASGKPVSAPLHAAPDIARIAPPVAPVRAVPFPVIERTMLSNGIPVELAHRPGVPRVEASVVFDAGYAADALDTPGTQAMMLRMLREGTGTLTGPQLIARQQRLGVEIGGSASLDTSSVNLEGLSVNLGPALDLMAQMIRSPAFRPADVERIKQQQNAQLRLTDASADAVAERTLAKALFGSHPYAQPANGMGTPASIAALSAPALEKAHDEWLRPSNARIFVAGDITMSKLRPMLERAFGSWRDPASPAPHKNLDMSLPSARPRVILIDRPGAPQSVIMAGKVLPVTGRDPHQEPLALANALLGGDFLSRLNSDLRERKGWSYGVRSAISLSQGPRAFYVTAPVQADRTGASIRAILDDMKGFAGGQPVTKPERDRIVEGWVRSLPGAFESGGQVLGAMERNALFGRPDTYYATLPALYRAVDTAQIAAAARRYLSPEDLVIVVVGDRKQVQPQLAWLGPLVEVPDGS